MCMMKVILLCSSAIMGIPSALRLKADRTLSCLVIPDKNKDLLLPAFMQAGFEEQEIHSVSKSSLENDLSDIIDFTQANTLAVITFPWKVPDSTLNRFTGRCFNFHPGSLPQYKGADPIFWQIKNREQYITLTTHIMTGEVDNGPVIMTEQIPLHPEETYGMMIQKTAWRIAENITGNIQAFTAGKTDAPSNNVNNTVSSYLKKPSWEDLQINWNQQTAEEILALVNACNPRYNGAITIMGGKQINILEVSHIQLNNAPTDVKPGQVVYADALYGVVIACINGAFLRLNIVCMEEGFISGIKLFGMGFSTGVIFS